MGGAGWGRRQRDLCTFIDQVASARFEGGKIRIEMQSGLETALPVAANSRLEGQPPEKLDHIELSLSL